MLDLESWASGSILTGGNILSLFFFCFHVVKPLMPILALLPMLCVCENPSAWPHFKKPERKEEIMVRHQNFYLAVFFCSDFFKKFSITIFCLMFTSINQNIDHVHLLCHYRKKIFFKLGLQKNSDFDKNIEE